jgi:hypothetical protein
LQKLKFSLLTGLLVFLNLVSKADLEGNAICKKYQGQTFAKEVTQNAIYRTGKTNHKISFVGETGQARRRRAVSAHRRVGSEWFRKVLNTKLRYIVNLLILRLSISNRRIAASELICNHLLVKKGIIMHQELELRGSLRILAFAVILPV